MYLMLICREWRVYDEERTGAEGEGTMSVTKSHHAGDTGQVAKSMDV